MDDQIEQKATKAIEDALVKGHPDPLHKLGRQPALSIEARRVFDAVAPILQHAERERAEKAEAALEECRDARFEEGCDECNKREEAAVARAEKAEAEDRPPLGDHDFAAVEPPEGQPGSTITVGPPLKEEGRWTHRPDD